ncbi:MAG: hypothetical protein ACFCU8_11440 [Thermosynechococcaceae cyanobacterium]
MKLQQIALISLLGLSTLPVLTTAPAQACTPAPDNPHGCDGINGTPRITPPVLQVRPKFKKPGPACLSCPPFALKLKDQREVVQPVIQDRNILLNQGRFQQQFEQPVQQSFGGY